MLRARQTGRRSAEGAAELRALDLDLGALEVKIRALSQRLLHINGLLSEMRGDYEPADSEVSF